MLPCLAEAAAEAPVGDDWVHELKLDGYRLLARKDGDRVRLWSRHALDWTAEFSRIARAVAALPCDQVVLDGEAVVVDEAGRCDLAALAGAEGRAAVVMVAFDALMVDGRDLRTEPLRERREALRQVVAGGNPILHPMDGVVGHGPEVFAQSCAMRQEGIVSKRLDAPYRAGRQRSWLKVKWKGYGRRW